jgi:2-C-methyl-D-erythritol 4-phosphate cytidylyltransferase
LDKYNAIDVVVPANDTIVQVNNCGSFLEKVPDRSVLRRGQTPQLLN